MSSTLEPYVKFTAFEGVILILMSSNKERRLDSGMSLRNEKFLRNPNRSVLMRS